MVSAPARCTNQDLISTKHHNRPKERNDGQIASLSHCTSMKQRATTTVFAPARCTNQDLISTKHRSRPKERNDGRIASLSHRTRGGYKNLPLPPPTTKRSGGYIEELSRTKVQNVRTGVLGFLLPSGKGVNTRTDNLRVHTAGSDTRTTSVGTIALSHNIVFICGGYKCPRWVRE
jgi:hypothetical protein